jgi:NADH dehydrogenase
VSSKLRDFTRKKMEQAGINVVLNRRVSHVTQVGVSFDDGVTIDGATIVCTVGNATAPVIQRLDAPKERGRLLTDPDMRVQGHHNVWAVGDCALVNNSYDNTQSPPTGQFAERQGRQTALNIARVINGKETKPFYFRPLGQLCAIGGHNAVAEFLGFHISGFLAWFLWRSVYLFKLPSFSHQLKVGFDWAWEIFYSRDLAHPKANVTDRVGKSHFQPGDYVFREGDPSNNFYIIESGEVEVVKNADKKDEKVLAILGAGDFFGEMALLDHRSRTSAIRARTELEVTVMGKKIFEQISSVLTPFKDFLADAVKRRSGSMWQKLPVVYEILQNQPLSVFIQPVDGALSPNDTFETAVRELCTKELEFCCVTDGSNKIKGILTQTDIFRAVESSVALNTRVSDFMTPSPIVVTETDLSTIVAATMRDHDLKWVPVVDNLDNLYVKGFIRRDKMITFVLDKFHEHHEETQAS